MSVISDKPEDIQGKVIAKVRFTPSENIKWDDWGTLRTVFYADVTYEGEATIEDGKVTYMGATTPYYNVSDSFHESEIASMKIEVVSVKPE